MELLYVWIENYKNIHEQGFNFSPNHRFTFEKTTQTLSEIKNSNSLPDKFFHNDITNITAIIGENGSGKSNLLEFIFELQRKRLVKKNDNKNYTEFRIESLNIDGRIFFKRFHNESDYVYYSPFFTGKQDSCESLDISTGRMLGNLTVDSKLNKKFIDLYNYHEFTKQINYAIFCRDKKVNLPFVPTNITINLLSENTNYLQQDIDMLEHWNLFESLRFQKQSDLYGSNTNPTDEKKEILENIRQNILKNYYMNINPLFIEKTRLKKEKASKERHKQLDRKIKNFNKEVKKLIKEFESCKKHFDKVFQTDGTSKDIKRKFNTDLALFVDDCMRFVGRNKIGYEEAKRIVEEYQNYNAIFEKQSFSIIDINWGLSAGEMAFFTLFSRFHSIKNNVKNNNLLILIDEGEIGFHPQWQKEYLSKLIAVLPEIFKGKTIQLILTSHSPFLCSDLPKENIIFLDKYIKDDTEVIEGKQKEGNCKVMKPENLSQTFGQNIHTLFSNSFFLKDGLIGKFAKEKINGVIKDLIGNQEIENVRKDEIQFIINSVGEPVIKQKLMRLYDDKFKFNIEDRISLLEKEIEELKKAKNNDTDL